MTRLESRALLLCGALLSAACGAADASQQGSQEDAGSSESRDGAAPADAASSASDADGPELHPDAGAEHDAAAADAEVARPAEKDLPYARHVVEFLPGEHAGFGADKLPKVVLGPPEVSGTGGGSLDVLSLGDGGEIVLDFGAKIIVDGEGADFVVFENVFWANGDPSRPFAEPAQVAVSADGETWLEFPCDLSVTTGAHPFPGCAGVTPTADYDPFTLLPLDVSLTGGDAFDLADVGLTEARLVRIRDRSPAPGLGNSAGFDLDAVGIVHVKP